MRLNFKLLVLLLITPFTACSEAPTTTELETTTAPVVNLNLRTLTEQNLVDILIGSCIQSTRNCDPSEFITEVKAALAEGKVFRTIKVDDVPKDGMVVAVQGIGGGGPWQAAPSLWPVQGTQPSR